MDNTLDLPKRFMKKSINASMSDANQTLEL